MRYLPDGISSEVEWRDRDETGALVRHPLRPNSSDSAHNHPNSDRHALRVAERRVSMSHDTWEQRLDVAAQYIQDALHGRKAHDLDILEKPSWEAGDRGASRALILHRIFNSSAWRYFIIVCVCVHTLLINFEVWSTWRHVEGNAHLSHSESSCIEIFFVCVYMADLYLFANRYGTRSFSPRSWGFMQLVITG